MPTFADQQAVTDRGIMVFKRIEDGATSLMADILKLHPIFDGANELLMPHTGINETRRINAKIDVAYGFVARALLAIAELHKDGTQIALDAGTDGLHPDGGPGR